MHFDRKHRIQLVLFGLPLLGAAMLAVFGYNGSCGGVGVNDAGCSKLLYFFNSLVILIVIAMPVALCLELLIKIVSFLADLSGARKHR